MYDDTIKSPGTSKVGPEDVLERLTKRTKIRVWGVQIEGVTYSTYRLKQ